MSSIVKEKIAICYVPCGPTYRESAYKQIKDYYFDDDNLYFCVLTDDKSYFDGLERKNLVVNELKDFYAEFPNIEKNEPFLESVSKEDYAIKFNTLGYLFPFSSYRFSVLQALKLGIKNVALLNTDTVLDFNFLDDECYGSNNFYNAVSEWTEPAITHKSELIVDWLKSKYDLVVDDKIRILDAAARMYFADSNESLQKLFDMWHGAVEYLYEINEMNRCRGHYGINDEYILAPIYNVLNLNKKDYHGSRIFNVQHNPIHERYWRYGGDGTIKEHTDYDEFLKINNITNND